MFGQSVSYKLWKLLSQFVAPHNQLPTLCFIFLSPSDVYMPNSDSLESELESLGWGAIDCFFGFS